MFYYLPIRKWIRRANTHLDVENHFCIFFIFYFYIFSALNDPVRAVSAKCQYRWQQLSTLWLLLLYWRQQHEYFCLSALLAMKETITKTTNYLQIIKRDAQAQVYSCYCDGQRGQRSSAWGAVWQWSAALLTPHKSSWGIRKR